MDEDVHRRIGISRHQIVRAGLEGHIAAVGGDGRCVAEAGGIGEMGKSYKIKILRGDPKNPKVYQADLSSLEGLKTSELRVLSNDIIYVDASSRFTKRLTTDILPILGIVTTLLLIGTYINR